MKKVFKKSIVKVISVVLCLCVTVTLFVLPITAASPASGGQEEYFVTSLLKSTRTVCLNKLVGWAMDGFMNAMFEPEDSEEVKLLKDIQEQMKNVLANQQKITDELKALKGLVEVQSYLDIINEYMEALALCEPFFQCYDTLNNLDKTYAGQPEALKIQRLRALTDGLGISNMTSANTSVDDKFLTLYSKFAGPISYSVNGQVISDGDLFDVYREIKRYQYCWENEAWDEMENFFQYATYSFALVSLIESASVQARIERCRIHNENLEVISPDYYSTASLETWLYNDGGTAAESDLESHIKRGNDVYDEHCVVRQDVFRHYWKPGYEVLVFTGINSLGTHPVDEPQAGKGNTSAGHNFQNTNGMRIKREGEKAQPVESFWNKFYDSSVYSSGNLLTTEAVNKMLTGCGHNLTLSEIIKAGDFTYTNCTSPDDCIGFVLRKDDTENPMKINESHDSTWVEYIGTVYTDKIRVYPTYVKIGQTNDLGKGNAENYKTYYYYHTSDGSVRWYVKDEYTSGSLAQIYLCEEGCMHSRLQWVESSGVEATCTAEGKEQDFKCLDCGKVFTGKTIPKKAHTGGTWQHTSTEHWKICETCGEKYNVSAHKSNSPTTFLTGLFICDDCGYINNISPVFSEDPQHQSPETGVYKNNILYIWLAVLSLGGITVCLINDKKKKTFRK